MHCSINEQVELHTVVQINRTHNYFFILHISINAFVIKIKWVSYKKLLNIQIRIIEIVSSMLPGDARLVKRFNLQIKFERNTVILSYLFPRVRFVMQSRVVYSRAVNLNFHILHPIHRFPVSQYFSYFCIF
ncbi:unnamed protein product, partial [Heterotrigona itama]